MSASMPNPNPNPIPTVHRGGEDERIDAARRRDLLRDLVVDREVAQRARHARLHLGVATVLRRCIDEGLDAARDSDLLGHLVRVGVRVRVRVRVRVSSATSSLSERLRSAPAT